MFKDSAVPLISFLTLAGPVGLVFGALQTIYPGFLDLQRPRVWQLEYIWLAGSFSLLAVDNSPSKTRTCGQCCSVRSQTRPPLLTYTKLIMLPPIQQFRVSVRVRKAEKIFNIGVWTYMPNFIGLLQQNLGFRLETRFWAIWPVSQGQTPREKNFFS